jgi:hypothetical protein
MSGIAITATGLLPDRESIVIYMHVHEGVEVHRAG